MALVEGEAGEEQRQGGCAGNWELGFAGLAGTVHKFIR